MTIAAYDTGGFGPQSQNLLYYHNLSAEVILLFLMLAGMLNFSLHADLWRGDRSEIRRNIEARTLALNVLILVTFTAFGLAGTAAFNTDMEVLRKGLFHVVSANSGTGHQTLYASQWSGMGGTAFIAIVLAMAFGGMVSSTAGGIKAMRIGFMWKGVMHSVKTSLSPDSAVVRTRFHHITDKILTPEMVSSALMVFALYMITYVTGGLVGAAYGYNGANAMFESVSAAANVGLSTGITSPDMPTGLKLVYMAQMWAGRLEFVALFSLFTALFVSVLRPLARRLVGGR